jgi:hypothetical protein
MEKNQLQEFCQKNKLQLPIYESNRIDNDQPHLPKWIASVIVNNEKFMLGVDKYENSKTLAERKVAKIAFDKINENNIICGDKKTKKTNESNDIDIQSVKYVILGDAENIKLLDMKYNENSVVIGFACQSFHMLDKYIDDKKWNIISNYIEPTKLIINKKIYKHYLFTIDDKINDLADHYLTMYASQIVISNIFNNATFIIVTKDHAGWCTSSVLRKLNSKINVRNYSSLKLIEIDLK